MQKLTECPFKNMCSIFRNIINTYRELDEAKKANAALKERLKLQREINGEEKPSKQEGANKQ